MPRGQVAVRSRAGMPNIMTILLGWCLPPDSGPCWGAEETRILFLWSLQASWHQLTFFGKWIKTRLSTSSSFQPSGGSGFVKQLHKVWKVAQNPSHPYPPPPQTNTKRRYPASPAFSLGLQELPSLPEAVFPQGTLWGKQRSATAEFWRQGPTWFLRHCCLSLLISILKWPYPLPSNQGQKGWV